MHADVCEVGRGADYSCEKTGDRGAGYEGGEVGVVFGGADVGFEVVVDGEAGCAVDYWARGGLVRCCWV